MSYIYQIYNDINDKLYIGKTENSIKERFDQHCRDAFRFTKDSRPLYSAMRKYGTKHFHIELIEETDCPEEREIYWIEQKQSFKNGYNATRGGDGRRYIDYDLVVATYKELKSIKDTADKLKINTDTVTKILRQNNIYIYTSQEVQIRKYGKVTNMYSLDDVYIRSFPSTNEAAKYMVENKLTGCKQSTIKQHITEVCTGRRKTAAKYKWKYAE